MATIKLQPSGKVVIKDGKVSCGCCGGPGECCMYPAQGLADAIYTADDLPDDVTVNGTSFPRSGTTYGNTTNGVIFEEDVWAKYESGVRSSRPCLIQGGVEDHFANSYNVEMSMFYDYVSGSCVVNRTSLGTWEGIAYGVGQGTWPYDLQFDGASVDLKVKLTICDSTIWELQYEPIAFYCDNLNPEVGLTCEEAIYNSGPGPFLQTVHYKFSENTGQDGQFQSSPNQGNGFYSYDLNYDNDIYGGLPLFGSKVS